MEMFRLQTEKYGGRDDDERLNAEHHDRLLSFGIFQVQRKELECCEQGVSNF